METYSAHRGDLEDYADTGRLLILTELANQKILTEEQYEEYSNNYTIILKKPSSISNFWNKILGKEDADKKRFIIVKQLSMAQQIKEEENNV